MYARKLSSNDAESISQEIEHRSVLMLLFFVTIISLKFNMYFWSIGDFVLKQNFSIFEIYFYYFNSYLTYRFSSQQKFEAVLIIKIH